MDSSSILQWHLAWVEFLDTFQPVINKVSSLVEWHFALISILGFTMLSRYAKDHQFHDQNVVLLLHKPGVLFDLKNDVPFRTQTDCF